jgi:trk system potassium uptake protein TrkA
MKKKIEKKEYLVIGLGRFGRSVAKQLEENGCSVLAIDRNEKNANQIADDVTLSMCVDITNEESLQELGVRNFDGAIIAIGENLEASVLATMWAKEQGVPLVIAKAYNEMQGKILAKIGADEIVYPERETGIHLANKLAFNQLFDTIELSGDYSIADIPVPKEWIGKNLKELRLREKYRVNVIATKHKGEMSIPPSIDAPLLRDDILMMLGTNETLETLANLNLQH